MINVRGHLKLWCSLKWPEALIMGPRRPRPAAIWSRAILNRRDVEPRGLDLALAALTVADRRFDPTRPQTERSTRRSARV